jgi:ferredoxin
VRIFTNANPKDIPLPEEEGYRYCEICKRWVSEENRHCTQCNECSSKVSPSCIKKSKDIPLTGRGDQQDCEMLRLPYFLDYRLTDAGEVVSCTCQPCFPQKHFLILISVRGSVSPKTTVQLEGLGKLKKPACSIVPEQTRLPHATTVMV